MITHDIVLNVKQMNALDTGIEVTQGDYGVMRFSMRVKDNDSYITDAAGAAIVFHLSNGYVIEGTATVSAGTFTYTFAGNELQSPGKVAATLTLKFANGRVSSCGFTFHVRYNPLYDNYFEAGSYIPQLERLTERIEARAEYLEQLISILQNGMGELALTRADVSNSLSVSTPGLTVADSNAVKQVVDLMVTKAMIVNNCVTDRADLPVSAAQAKALMDTVVSLQTKVTGYKKPVVLVDGLNIQAGAYGGGVYRYNFDTSVYDHLLFGCGYGGDSSTTSGLEFVEIRSAWGTLTDNTYSTYTQNGVLKVYVSSTYKLLDIRQVGSPVRVIAAIPK